VAAAKTPAKKATPKKSAAKKATGPASTSRKRRAPVQKTAPPVRVDRFFKRHLHHFTGQFAGELFELERWQRDEIIAPLFGTLDRNGFRTYREALIGIARGNGKSPLAAGIALYGLYADNEPGAEVFSLAASKAQARIVFGAARQMVLSSPLLSASSKVYKDAIEVLETGSVYRVISSNSDLAHGYNPHIVVVDELHVHKKPDLYEAMQSALHKRRQPLLVSITTAGFDRKTIAWQLYQRGILGTDPRFFFKWYSTPDDANLNDTRGWRLANPGSWITIAALRDQRRRMPEPVFRRLHLNQWTATSGTWLRMDLWDRCSGRPRIPKGAPVVIAVDAAPKRDTTAVIVDHRTADGHHHVLKWIFEVDPEIGYLDFDAVEDLLRELAQVYDVRRMLFDKYAMVRSMLTLAGEGLPVEEFPQTDSYMVPASQGLFDLITEQKLHHGGDPDMREQASVAVARETARGWRLHKLMSTGHIDSIVALAMAAHVAELEAANDTVSPTVITAGAR
jgi:phage terminase large subunit-like protein